LSCSSFYSPLTIHNSQFTTHMKYLLFILAASSLLHACSEDFFSQTVKIDPPEYDKQLSFHLLLDTKDSVVRLIVTRNYGILESVDRYEDWYVKGATAELYENGQKWLTLNPVSVDSSFILTAVLPHAFQTGSTYEIRATHPDFPAVDAVQVVPADFQLDSARVKYDAVPGEFGYRYDLAEVFIQDAPGVKNFYEIRLFKLYIEYEYDPNTNTFDTVRIWEYPLNIDGFNDPNVKFGYGSSGVISDQFFDGQPYKFQARFDSEVGGSFDSTLYVSVLNITEDCYKWSYSYNVSYESEENPLVEPVTIFHNLNNGLGIFSVANRKDLGVE
jgi:Domain of unknown function (DUF4249)